MRRETPNWRPEKSVDQMSLVDVAAELTKVQQLIATPGFSSNLSRVSHMPHSTDPMKPRVPVPSESDQFLQHTVDLQQRRLDLVTEERKRSQG